MRTIRNTHLDITEASCDCKSFATSLRYIPPLCGGLSSRGSWAMHKPTIFVDIGNGTFRRNRPNALFVNPAPAFARTGYGGNPEG